jgi:hypothetical protein
VEEGRKEERREELNERVEIRGRMNRMRSRIEKKGRHEATHCIYRKKEIHVA